MSDDCRLFLFRDLLVRFASCFVSFVMFTTHFSCSPRTTARKEIDGPWLGRWRESGV